MYPNGGAKFKFSVSTFCFLTQSHQDTKIYGVSPLIIINIDIFYELIANHIVGRFWYRISQLISSLFLFRVYGRL